MTIAPPSLPGGTQGEQYPSQNLIASGGTTPYRFARLSGALPPGLALSADGVLNGTPASVGSYNFSARATDAKGNSGQQDYTVVIVAPRCPTGMYRLGGECACPAGLTKEGNTCTQVVAVAIAPPTLPGGTQGETYPRQNLIASGGTAPYQFASGGLPPGSTLSIDGALTGTPTSIGSYGFTAIARDAKGSSAAHDYTVIIAAPRCPAGMYRLGGECACPAGLTREGNSCKEIVSVSISPPTLPDGMQGDPYSSQKLTASGGAPPYQFASGGLPLA